MAGPGLAESCRNLWGRFCSSDPGLTQLRLAGRSAVGVAVGVAVGYLGAQLTGQPVLIPILLCAVLSMNITFSVAEPARSSRLVTVALMPLPVALAMLLATSLTAHRPAALAGFVGVMFVAVYIRRFGPRFFAYGLVGWMSYFMTMFTGLRIGQLPAMLLVVGLETVAMAVLQVLVFRHRPNRVLLRMTRAFQARVSALAETSLAQVAGTRPGGRVDRAQRIGLIRLNESALLIDGQLGMAGSLPEGHSEEAVRHELLAAEFAIGTISAAATQLRAQRGTTGAREPADVRAALTALSRGDLDAAAAAGERLSALGVNSGSAYAATAAAYRLGTSILDLVRALRNLTAAPAGPGSTRQVPFTPSVVLFNGRLPGAGPLAGELGGEPGTGLRALPARMRLTTRQAFQVALAGGLAIGVGSLINEQRYYWAVLACFMAFTGTATAAETISKAADRALGTLVGVGVATLFASLTHGNLVGVMIVVLGSILVGFFLMRFTYALAVVFMTTMVAQLYEVLHEFSAGLLLLRLEETAAGAVVGCVVAVCFLPTSTRRVARMARRRFLVATAELLAGTGARLRGGRGLGADLRASARAADAALQQLLTVTRPWTLPALFGSESPFPGARDLRQRMAMYSLLADQARSLAVLVHLAPRPDVHLAGTLARICDLLGERVRALSAGTALPPGTAEVSRRLDTVGLTLVSWYGVTDEGPRRILAQLRHLDETTGRIAAGGPGSGTPPPPPEPPAVRSPTEPVPDTPRARPATNRCTANSIRGLVSRPDHRPTRAVVTLIDRYGRQAARAETDHHGRYALTPRRAGVYLLVCTPSEPVATPGARTAPHATAVVAMDEPVTCDIVLPGEHPATLGCEDGTEAAFRHTSET
ncbi:FUSC family protein [Amycolatopsis acidiphila]|uniref:FUSC family protein n=1 Tax=Amycolatopsis acidiphila TaxID=715473 RepID=UPI001643A762|nr:FUSC family protein [Amycolatopsis acidiphila]UIJ57308.1 FUSC family protein [Amycolatopsis acidiphila]GHG84904.1 membrane protein [Amycolatopsis acidiphila]